MRGAEPKVFKKDGKQRYGRGFSLEELEKAGLRPMEAMKAGLPVDFRRRTAHEDNVEAVRSFLGDKKPLSESKKRSKS
ncbi:MAG: ribosomal protein L13e [Candidatus Bathycorpusculaceae bacterium]